MKTWYVISDPSWKGKHPLHDARYVATCDESKIEVTQNDDGEKSWRFEDPADSIICTMPDSPQQKEHARLIVAAPDLLEACKAACDLLGKIPAFGDTIGTETNKPTIGIVHHSLKSAIQKAVGQS